MRVIQGMIMDNDEGKFIVREFAASKRGFTSKHKELLADKRHTLVFVVKDIDLERALSGIADKDAREAIGAAARSYYK